METRPRRLGGGRVFGSLVLFETLFVSSFQPTGQSVAETEVEEVPSAVVIIPDWPTAHWFPLILEMVIN